MRAAPCGGCLALGAIAGAAAADYVKIESKSEFAALIRQLARATRGDADADARRRHHRPGLRLAGDRQLGLEGRVLLPRHGLGRKALRLQLPGRGTERRRAALHRGPRAGRFGRFCLRRANGVRLRSRWPDRSSRNRRNAQVPARRARQARPAARRPAPWRGARGLGQRPLGSGGKVAGQVVSGRQGRIRTFLHSGDGQARRPCAGSPGYIRRTGGGTRRCKDASGRIAGRQGGHGRATGQSRRAAARRPRLTSCPRWSRAAPCFRR